MPKKASRYGNLSVSLQLLQRYRSTYDKIKKSDRGQEFLKKRGIRSFTSFVNYILEEEMQRYEVMALRAPMLELIAVDENRVVIRDRKLDRIAEVAYDWERNDLYCQLCQRDDCYHVGFAYSIPEVNEKLTEEGYRFKGVRP